MRAISAVIVLFLFNGVSVAQIAPSRSDITGYKGLHEAAWQGDTSALQVLISQGADIEVRDAYQRTPLHIAAYASNDEIIRLLAAAGADMNALEHDRYDIATIAAVADDVELLELALELGNSAKNITSRYDGTALIAAAHLGHAEIVQALIDADAPLNHVNNLGWTALIEAVVLGDGGERHIATVKALVAAGADRNIGDRQGRTPLELAQQRGYEEMIALLESK